MLMCKCCNCGEVFLPDDVARYKDNYDKETGMYEVFSACPRCLGDYEEIEGCPDCYVEAVFDTESEKWVCPECGREVE